MGKRKREKRRSLFLSTAPTLQRQRPGYTPPETEELDALALGDLVRLAAAGRPAGPPVEWLTVELTSIDEGVYVGAISCDPAVISAQRDDELEFSRDQILEIGAPAS